MSFILGSERWRSIGRRIQAELLFLQLENMIFMKFVKYTSETNDCTLRM